MQYLNSKELKHLFLFTVKVLIAAFIITGFFFRVNIIYGNSMSPSLNEGARIITNLFLYRIAKLKRFDVVISKCPYNPKKEIIKRVVGLEGEKIQIINGLLYINDSYVPQDFNCGFFRENYGPVNIKRGYVFLMGDNRTESEDSRSYGPVDKNLITGKAQAKIWPPGRIR
ncbi:MAG: signal peptidase I [Armatimonadota bacterium]